MLPPYEIRIEGKIYRLADGQIPTPAPVTGILLPAGNFKQIEHDYQAKDGLVRIGMPAVYPLILDRYCDLTERWQWIWFAHMVDAYKDYKFFKELEESKSNLTWVDYKNWILKNLTKTELTWFKVKWRNFTKTEEALTNFKGTNAAKPHHPAFHDYITPNNLSGLPAQEPLACTGNIVKILGDETRIAGKIVVPIETLRGDVVPPMLSKLNRKTHPHIVMDATSNPAIKENPITKEKYSPDKWKPVILSDGTQKVELFHILYPKKTPFLLRTHGRQAQELDRKKVTKIAGTYEDKGISYAVNYILSSRLQDFSGKVVPKSTNP